MLWFLIVQDLVIEVPEGVLRDGKVNQVPGCEQHQVPEGVLRDGKVNQVPGCEQHQVPEGVLRDGKVNQVPGCEQHHQQEFAIKVVVSKFSVEKSSTIICYLSCCTGLKQVLFILLS
eukprot:EG_transcript_46112